MLYFLRQVCFSCLVSWLIIHRSSHLRLARLFMQSLSDDATHDEALSSRIAAVNILDLTLGHLGVDVGESVAAVESVVKACGESA